MDKQYLDINGARIAFLRFGGGDQLLVAIPGYGDRAVLFNALEESLSEKYSVYVLELPLHGASSWSRKVFARADFAEAICQIMRMENKNSLSLMGYSFGGRVVFSLLSEFVQQIDHIFLLAPDGFNKEYINRATFLPRPVRFFLQSALKNPSWYLGLLNGLHRLGLLKSYSYHFVQRHMATEKRRERLFLYWNSLDDFKYDEQKVAVVLEQQKIQVILILGATDRVIPTKRWAAWGEKERMIDVHLVGEGHRLIGKNVNELLKKIL